MRELLIKRYYEARLKIAEGRGKGKRINKGPRGVWNSERDLESEVGCDLEELRLGASKKKISW